MYKLTHEENTLKSKLVSYKVYKTTFSGVECPLLGKSLNK